MPVINRTFLFTASPKPFLAIKPTRHLSTTSYHRTSSNFQTQSWTSSYETGRPTEGPLSKASRVGASFLTPSLLKEHVDKFVVGQDKAKKVTCVAIYNHYQRIREIKRQEQEEEERWQRAHREQKAHRDREKEASSHPVENKYPGHVETVDLNAKRRSASPEPDLISAHSLHDPTPTIIEKSNLLLLGPSGVGKTYILKTLARVLSVPFATIDCSSLTQAGYIGTDIESSIERLLLAASYSIPRAETGIIFFDELDKLSKPPIMTHGRDVSGEGVQQGLLKMIEGAAVTVKTTPDKASKSDPAATSKHEQFTVDTTNILFVFAGAFIGLEKIIAKRLSSGHSIGFGAQLQPSKKEKSKNSNILDKVSPTDLQTYGLIPELLGRIPSLVALTPLSLPHLISILTEPRNSLVKQYTALFSTYGINLRFTSGALSAVAERALGRVEDGGGIGARGLRGILEGVLGEVMFWGPGSGVRFCLIDEAFVRSQFPAFASGLGDKEEDEKAKMPRCWSRGQGRWFDEAFEMEEAEWRRGKETVGDSEARSFEALRSVGSSGM